MLTGKMVRVRHAKNRLVPLYVEPNDEGLRALAGQLLLAYRGAPGRTRGEIEEEFADLIPEGPRGLLPAGLAKLLEDRCEFEVASDIPPDQLREAVFKAAAVARVEAASAMKPFDPLSSPSFMAAWSKPKLNRLATTLTQARARDSLANSAALNATLARNTTMKSDRFRTIWDRKTAVVPRASCEAEARRNASSIRCAPGPGLKDR
mgnify:CR=1 FL=1